ncbi:MAG TPA: ACT domain-containing protein, partial [Chromatiaceae bacterium]|nr:ACT domain-containing protein [Chromatiaceae bacterium]
NAGVPLLALSTFERDHILVPDDLYTAALEALVSAQS